MSKEKLITDDCFEKGKWLQRRFVGPKYTWTVSGVLWNNLKERCTKDSATQVREPTYIGSKNLFKDFEEFVEWNQSQIGYAKGYDLDSDILKPKSKIYSPSTCLLIPSALNRFLQSHSKDSDLPIGVQSGKGHLYTRCTLVCDETGDTIVLLSKYFKPSQVEAAATAYAEARTSAGQIWYKRLLSGKYQVDQKVIDYMKNWKFEHEISV